MVIWMMLYVDDLKLLLPGGYLLFGVLTGLYFAITPNVGQDLSKGRNNLIVRKIRIIFRIQINPEFQNCPQVEICAA